MVCSFSLKMLSNLKLKVSIYLVIPSTSYLGYKICISGLLQFIQSISPFSSSLLNIGLFLIITHILKSSQGLNY